MAENHLFPSLKCSCAAYFISPMDSATEGGSTIPPIRPFPKLRPCRHFFLRFHDFSCLWVVFVSQYR